MKCELCKDHPGLFPMPAHQYVDGKRTKTVILPWPCPACLGRCKVPDPTPTWPLWVAACAFAVVMVIVVVYEATK